MFEKNIKNDKFDNFITVLINNEDSRNFIFDYINFGKNLKKFIDIITQKWQQICIFIFKESQFTEEKKEIYFKILFDNLILDNLLKLNIEDSLKVYIEISQKVPDNSIFNDKFKELIRKLKVKYQNIDDTYEKNPAFFEFIYKENLYKLNEKMIDKMIFIKGEPRKISEEKLKISTKPLLKIALNPLTFHEINFITLIKERGLFFLFHSPHFTKSKIRNSINSFFCQRHLFNFAFQSFILTLGSC